MEPNASHEACMRGPTIRVYSPARTAADCFKFRSNDGAEQSAGTSTNVHWKGARTRANCSGVLASFVQLKLDPLESRVVQVIGIVEVT
jgi:hypothetical protein